MTQPAIFSTFSTLGTGIAKATTAIPYLSMHARNLDPDAQGVQVIVRTLQNGLNQMGWKLSADGNLGRKTATALNWASPPNRSFLDKSLLQVLFDVADAIKRKRKAPRMTTRDGEIVLLRPEPSRAPLWIAGALFVGAALYIRSTKS